MNNAIERIQIEEWRPTAESAAADIAMLADVLHAVVHAGAGISFIVPFSIVDSRRWWSESVYPAVCAGARRVVVARDGGRIVGTVQLELEVPPNQKHRASVAKMMVHPDARRRGTARALMVAMEEIARAERRTLLTLDTVTGSSAEKLYGSLGFIVVGVIPRFARGSITEELDGTTIMYKELTRKSEVS